MIGFSFGVDAKSIRSIAKSIRDVLVREGFAKDEELNELTQDLKRHHDDPDTLVVSHLFFQVWGRKPEHQGREHG